jgi:hypothetical protein
MKGTDFRSELDSILNSNATPAIEDPKPILDKEPVIETSFTVVYKTFVDFPAGNNKPLDPSFFTHERSLFYNGKLVKTTVTVNTFECIDSLYMRLLKEADLSEQDAIKVVTEKILKAFPFPLK